MMSRTTAHAGRATRLLLGLTLALIAAPEARAQGAKLLVGDEPKTYAKAEKVKVFPVGGRTDAAILWLRPNDKGQFSLFVDNPADEAKSFVVKVIGPGKKTPLATSAEVTVPAKTIAPVSLAPPPPPKKPAAEEPAPKPPAAKEAAFEGLVGEGLAPQLQFQLIPLTRAPGAKPEEPGKEAAAPAYTVQVALLRPKRYLRIDNPPAYDPLTHRLSVSVEAREFLAGDPCPVRMTVQFENPKTGQLEEFVPQKGVFERPLKAGEKVELFAEDPRLAEHLDAKGYVTIRADGYERAWRFQINLSATTGKTVSTEVVQPDVLLESQRYIMPGAVLPVVTAVENIGQLADATTEGEGSQLDNDVNILLEFGRPVGGKKFDAYFAKTLPGHRRQRVALDLAAGDGAIGFHTAVSDWLVDVPTHGVFGDNFLHAQARDVKTNNVVTVDVGPEKSRPLDAVRSVSVDGAPPVFLIDPENPPVAARLTRGKPLTVRARVLAPKSGIKSVVFFAGKAVPDPKAPGALMIPETTPRAKGKRSEDRVGPPTEETARIQVWEAVLEEVPTDKKGKIDVTVEAVSGAGVKELGHFDVELKEPKAGASISGTVTEGGRGQPGLTVTLRDPMGAVKATTTTKEGKDAGKYVFKDVPPGAYVVVAVKTKSATRGEAPVEVKNEDKEDVNVKLLR
jgi:hypothetical protein